MQVDIPIYIYVRDPASGLIRILRFGHDGAIYARDWQHADDLIALSMHNHGIEVRFIVDSSTGGSGLQ